VRRDLLLLAALLCAFAVALTRGAGPPAAPAANPEAPSAPPTLSAPEPPPSLRRNPFEFGLAPVAAPSQRPAAAGRALPPALEVPAPPAAARLVGFVVQAGRTRAVVAIAGETHLLQAGEEAAGYVLISLDETGVRLRTPDGGELALTVPE
jgi:hypothetical protein